MTTMTYPSRETVDNLLEAAGWSLLQDDNRVYLLAPTGIMYVLPTADDAWDHYLKLNEISK